MAWELRRGRAYYYRRSGGRKVYVGAGFAAEAIADLDALDRQDRAREREAERVEVERLREALGPEDALAAFCAQADTRLVEYLTAAGYHRHHRGEWRRRRAAP